ncbi:hypothetical protein F5Y04DRAFT_283331 [Hypomontagnella monticulosa]|nr:hypothetical protein F5Y04DRAFT_283331 [Hypomontagnella monticulosa]
MEEALIKVPLAILEFQQISSCIVGEVALNYYNVPRVLHDIEICVPADRVLEAAALLCSTGLFQQFPAVKFDLFTEYKQGHPRLRPTFWTTAACAVIILPDTLFGLQPLEESVVRREERNSSSAISTHIVDVIPSADLTAIPVPRLYSYFVGLCRRYLDQADDAAMIAAEQLVDGMNLDQDWCTKNISTAGADVWTLSQQLILDKPSRIDQFSGNTVTCFIADETEAKKLRDIPGSANIDLYHHRTALWLCHFSRSIFLCSTLAMIQDRLNDAAIALFRILSNAGIHFGIFGGYAIAAMGGPRESKDIDCLASVSKEKIIELLDGINGFAVIPQTRRDYVAFLWSDRPDRGAVLVEIFCEQFPGARYSLGSIQTNVLSLNGQTLGQGHSSFFDPFHLFKGKLRAAATRPKFHDSADLRWLGSHFGVQIRPHISKLDPVYVGLAVSRYSILERLFVDLGVDVEAAKTAAKDQDPNNLPQPQPGDVQKGLLG